MNSWLICVLVFVFCAYIFGTYTFNEELPLFVQLTLVSLIVVVLSLTVNTIFYYRHKSTKFTISYLFLAFSFVFYIIAEILWGYYDFNGFTAYPSWIDLFYALDFIFAALFCFKIVWSGKSIMPNYIKIVGILVGIGGMSLYLILSYGYYDSEVFGHSTIMMVISSVLMASSVLTTLYIYKSPDLKKIWTVFGIAITVNCIADIYYYAGENAGLFQYTDWTNLVWFGSLLLLFYGIHTHRHLYTKF